MMSDVGGNEGPDGCIQVEGEGVWRRLVLNRPKKLNAFNVRQHDSLTKSLDTIARDQTVRAVVLTGRGRAFSAGQDLHDRLQSCRAEKPDLGATISAYWNPLIQQIRAMPFPTIAAVNGVAAGAGANLALACDVVIAARSASFVQAFSSIGLIPDSGGTFILPRLVGHARAYAIAAFGGAVSAEMAESMGMIWKVVDDNELESAALEIARELAARPTHALVELRHAIMSSSNATFEEHLAYEATIQAKLGFTPDYLEGVNAFVEKREPKWAKRTKKLNE